MLDVSGLNAFYGSAHILHDVSLSIANHQRVALVGRNGAGKSTFLKSLLNAGPRVDGDVRFNGQDLAGVPSHRRARAGLAFVPEDRRILHHLTVYENIVMAARGVGARGGDPAATFARFDMLQPLRERKGGQLSGGQQQMLAIARALVMQPEIFLLDEPTEGLAPVIVQELAQEVIRSCEETGAALLLCEQNLWFARRCTDFVYVIDSGGIVFSGDWPSFDADTALRQKYLSV